MVVVGLFLKIDHFFYIVIYTALQRELDNDATKVADMWSFAIILWELVTRKVPFAGLSPMEIGLKVA